MPMRSAFVILGMRSPLLTDCKSRMDDGSGGLPVSLILTFCENVMIGKRRTTKAEMIARFNMVWDDWFHPI